MKKSPFKDSTGKIIRVGDTLRIYDPKDIGPRKPLIVGKVGFTIIDSLWFVGSWRLDQEMAENSVIVKKRTKK